LLANNKRFTKKIERNYSNNNHWITIIKTSGMWHVACGMWHEHEIDGK